MKLYRETPCEHDQVKRHRYSVDCHRIGCHTDHAKMCPGGSREEVTIDYEAAKNRLVEYEYFTLDDEGDMRIAKSIVDAALKSAGFTKKFASEK